jgi:hypothetical protein
MVKCLICGVEKKCSIKDHLKHTHKISKKEYTDQFPNAKVTSEDFKKEISKREILKWGDDSFKQKMSEIRKISHNKPEFKQKMSEITKNSFILNPNRFTGFTEYYKTDEFKRWVISPERIEKISKASKQKWSDDTHRKKVIETLKSKLSDGRCVKSDVYKQNMSEIISNKYANGDLDWYKTVRFNTGTFTNKNGENFYYMSSLELNTMIMLDSNSSVHYWTNKHGIKIPYVYNNIKRNYIPDFLIKLNNNKEFIIEMKGFKTELVDIKTETSLNSYKNYRIFYDIETLKQFINNEI